jgi:hypothetical protein
MFSDGTNCSRIARRMPTGAAVIVTHNRADFVRSEMPFPVPRILAPAELLKET